MWGRIALSLGTLVALLGLAEGVARWMGPPDVAVVSRRGDPERWQDFVERARERAGVDPETPGSVPPDSTNPATLELPELRTLVELDAPSVVGIHNGVLYRTNRHHFRGPEYAPEPRGLRIAVAGDSVTMGAGVPEEQVYARVLEDLLDRERPGLDVEVVNVGLSGYNANAIVSRLERAVELYHPHLLVYGYTLNDIEGPHYERVGGDRSGADAQAAQSSPSYLWRWLWPRLTELRGRVLGLRPRYVATLEHNYLENEPAWAEVTRALDRLAALAEREGVCAHLLIHPRLEYLNDHHPYGRLYERVAAAARERGITVTNPWDRFDGRSPADLRLGVYDAHPNAEGHALLADALRDGLVALPAACWRP